MSKPTTDHRSDNELLLAYGRDGDEAAFDALARRHVDMIFAVNLRRSGNRQLAEEATQNVLIALTGKARKSPALGGTLTAWLHTSTRFEVAKLRRRETRIKLREQAYATETMNASTQPDDDAFRRLLPILDQAIDQLRAPDREVIVRRYLEGQDFRGIGEALGISEDAAQKRTSRAFDCLNRFFKRKAGVTVSATALAAGISRHCVEAAPAACLQITASASSAALASIFTTATVTTMSMGKITAVAAAGVVAIGGAVVFLKSGDSIPPETVATSRPANSDPGSPPPVRPHDGSVAASTAGADSATGGGRPHSPNEELANMEALSPHPSQDEMARRLSVKHGLLIEDLTAALGLGEEQVASLKTVLDNRLKSFRASLDLRDEMEMLVKAGGLIRGAGLRDDLADILSESQLAAFDEWEKRDLQSEVESLAYLELSKLAPVLKLSAEQKDRAFELLQASSAEKLGEDGNFRAFLALQKNKTPVQMDMTDLAEANFLASTLDGPNPPSPDSPEFRKQITEIVGAQIAKQFDLLAPVLDQAQKRRFQDHLVSTSLLPMFGIELPAPSEK